MNISGSVNEMKCTKFSILSKLVKILCSIALVCVNEVCYRAGLQCERGKLSLYLNFFFLCMVWYLKEVVEFVGKQGQRGQRRF